MKLSELAQAELESTQKEYIRLLKRFEPIIHYNRGEKFFPMNVEPYIRANGMWVARPNSASDEMLVAPGQLTPELLCAPRPEVFGAIHYLKPADPEAKPDRDFTLARRDLKASLEVFKAGAGRLARVGYTARFVDALFTLTLLTRGRVPVDTARNINQLYLRLMAQQERYQYYGRVLVDEKSGWITLQYWFFYAYNSWRTGFFGINDHQADWEMMCIYLYQDSESERIQPRWLAYASHDYSGDDLRRHWEDPEVRKVGEHPVIYAGAGSHASYFQRGEYMVEMDIPFMKPVVTILDRLVTAWNRILKQGDPDAEKNMKSIFRIPFIDYARGDGVCIGPGQPIAWDEPELLNPVPDWAANYRGLWGFYPRDPLGGENAPSGPVYNRDGSTRLSWADPLSWAGMEKVPIPPREIDYALAQIELVQQRQQTLKDQLEAELSAARQLQVEAAAMRGAAHLGKTFEQHDKAIETANITVKQIQNQLASEEALKDALLQYTARLRAGESGPLRAHIRRAHLPASETDMRTGKIVEFWAAISIGLLLMIFVGLLLFARAYLFWGLAALITLFTLVESYFRRRLTNLLSSLAIGLSIISALVLFYQFFWYIISAVVLAAGVYLLWDNLR